MKLTYSYDHSVIEIGETANDPDIEFDIRVPEQEDWDKLKLIRDRFEDDDVYTDVLFYAYENHKARIIVRKDYYEDFILALMKHGLLTKVEWV